VTRAGCHRRLAFRLALIVGCSLLPACVQTRQPPAPTTRAAALAEENNGLRQQLAAAKDEARAREAYIERVTATLNEIEEKLAELRGRQREFEITNEAIPSIEVVQKRSGALSDLEAIDAELTALRRKLKQSAASQPKVVDVRPLRDLVATYERRIQEQQTELQRQKAEIQALQARLASAQAAAEEVARDAEAARVELGAAREQAVTIRYLIASEGDLVRAGILRKRGVLGLGGKQFSVADLGQSELATACLLRINEFALPAEAKEPRFWTAHPPDSFEWRTENRRLTLVVRSPEAFVLLSRVMVVSYKR
jgi:hypothetical protein